MSSIQPTQAASGYDFRLTSQPFINGSNNNNNNTGALAASIISTSQLPNTIRSVTGQQQYYTLPQQLQTQHQFNGQTQQQTVGGPQPQTLFIKANHAIPLPRNIVPNAPRTVNMTETMQQGNQALISSLIPASGLEGMRPTTTAQQQLNNACGPVMVVTRPHNPMLKLTPGQTPNNIVKIRNEFQGKPQNQQQANVTSNNATGKNFMMYTSSQANISMKQHYTTTNAVNSLQQQQQQQLSHLQTQPQIIQLPKVPVQQVNQIQQIQQQQHPKNANNIVNSTNNVIDTTTGAISTPISADTKAKCHKLLVKLIALSTLEPQPAEQNVRNLVQDLVNAYVEPEEFCKRLESILNANPQPCLIVFLKKSLPLLRQALYTKELAIEGIKPPPQHALCDIIMQPKLPKILEHIGPISQNQTIKIGQSQVRMISPASTAASSIRIQGPTNGTRLLNTAIRGPVPQKIFVPQRLESNVKMVQNRAPNGTQLIRPNIVSTQLPNNKIATKATVSPLVTNIKVGQIKPISLSTPLAVIKNTGMPTATCNLSSSTVNSVSSSTPQGPTAVHTVDNKQFSTVRTNTSSMSKSSYDDDDINDVAAMAGINVAEEMQHILGGKENSDTELRSCKDETLLNLSALQERIRSIVIERGLEEPSQDVATIISHACEEHLKNIVEKLAAIAKHRTDPIKLDPSYEVAKDVRDQVKFLEAADKAEQKRHENLEREVLLHAAKSRSKFGDSELKARAKEMKRAEMEEIRRRDANWTALQALGSRKKLKLDGNVALGPSAAPSFLRPRINRINLRDMIFFMEQDRTLCRSQMLYKAYLK